MKQVRQGKISYLQPGWAQDAQVVAGFTTRNGGVSRAPFNSLNLGFNTDDPRHNVEANRSTLARAFDLQPHLLLTTRQVHGADLLVIDEPNPDLAHFQQVECDGILTNQPGILIGVLVADCYPVVFHDPLTRAAGVVHVGWRGAAARILPKAVRAMGNLFGSRPENLRAAVGPGIGAHKYEVDRPVRDAFRAADADWDAIAVEKDLGKWQLDLRACCTLQLRQAGLAAEHIEAAGECTCCHRELFFSHRRDQGHTGRQMGFVMLPI
ncbi:peptidoglycan editing factor PgeF [Geoalkalibacter halelectricus]|uniref:Purine nucleoside phosphorylase n=1 Tax=Geoalkalibacter halelectricus TaxID=2847045 RepID=A0ABY5ZSA4_9BACT|nr:peptidoglycan editing factor PgeF [Geoalkalibacter halelectricus]MDO3377613.1 peptidoglycan editing factor PgeF [Geoalkalibacter halelectricus]UWZ81404.1 peptidoglycan editing factor PgeF [Geoalkalibacter halelectricus]